MWYWKCIQIHHLIARVNLHWICSSLKIIRHKLRLFLIELKTIFVDRHSCFFLFLFFMIDFRFFQDRLWDHEIFPSLIESWIASIFWWWVTIFRSYLSFFSRYIIILSINSWRSNTFILIFVIIAFLTNFCSISFFLI